jgi:TP901 family phage tail tape measure protein
MGQFSTSWSVNLNENITGTLATMIRQVQQARGGVRQLGTDGSKAMDATANSARQLPRSIIEINKELRTLNNQLRSTKDVNTFEILAKQIRTRKEELKGLRKELELTQQTPAGPGAMGNLRNAAASLPGVGAFLGPGGAALAGVTMVAGGFAASVKMAQDFEDSLLELSAITGISGAGLDQLGLKARNLGTEFGTGAAQNVEMFKTLISQLGPAIAENPEAMAQMGQTINLLSKQLGGDMAAATEAATTMLNQFNISMDDPIAGAAELSRMINIASASAQAGSAEFGPFKAALEQAGVAAYGAHLQFSEVAAAIQALDKGGKRGAEGGVALRNVLTKLADSSKLARDQFAAMGIDLIAVRDTLYSKGLLAGIEQLQGGLNKVTNEGLRAEMVSNLFGAENLNAYGILARNVDVMREMQAQIVGTNSLQEMAAKIMQSNTEAWKRFTAQLQEAGIKVGTAVLPVLTTLFNGLTGFLSWINDNGTTTLTILGTLAALVLTRVVPSFIAGGGAAGLLTGAITALSGAMQFLNTTNPFGWVALAIGALAVLYQQSEQVRAVLHGLGGAVAGFVKGLWEQITGVFGALGDLVQAALSGDVDSLKKALTRGASALTAPQRGFAQGFREGYDSQISRTSPAATPANPAPATPVPLSPATPAMLTAPGAAPGPTTGSAPGLSTTGASAGASRTLTVNVHMVVNTLADIRDQVARALTDAVRDAEIALDQ